MKSKQISPLSFILATSLTSGPLSNCVEIATRWYGPSERLSTLGGAFLGPEELDFNILLWCYSLCRATEGLIVKVIRAEKSLEAGCFVCYT